MSERTSFVHRFFPAYGAVLGCTLPVAIVAAQLDFGIVDHPWKAAALAMFVVALAALLTLVWTRMRVTVSPEGLHCYSASGAYQFARWEEMTWARPTRMVLGLPYLRVGLDDERSPTWLPMFLADMPRFVELVLAYAGSGHPVAVVLSKRIGAQPGDAAGGRRTDRSE